MLDKAKFSIFDALYENFEKRLHCSYHYTDTDSIFLNISIPNGCSIIEE